MDGWVWLDGLTTLTSVSLPALTTVNEGLRVSFNPALTSIADLGARIPQAQPELQLTIMADRFRRRQSIAGAVFCCVDSITARRAIWNAVKQESRFWCDGRMLGEVIRVLSDLRAAEPAAYVQTYGLRSTPPMAAYATAQQKDLVLELLSQVLSLRQSGQETRRRGEYIIRAMLENGTSRPYALHPHRVNRHPAAERPIRRSGIPARPVQARRRHAPGQAGMPDLPGPRHPENAGTAVGRLLK